MDKKVECWKRDYLIKTLSRTKRKDYENYVVNRIWNLLDNYEIKPVTQQYVKLENGKHVFIDLFFPQFNIGVECDEKPHKGKVKKSKDDDREKKIEAIITKYIDGENFTMERIDVDKPIEDINARIGEVVEIINQSCYEVMKNNNNILEWHSPDEEILVIRKKGSLTISDNIGFPTIVKTCECFGKSYKQIQRAFIKIKDDSEYYLWFPQLSIMEDGKPKVGAGGWTNQLSLDGTEIHESNKDKTLITDNKKGRKLITFAKSRDVLGKNMYRFVGVFQMEDLIEGSSCATYKKIADEIDLTQFIK